MTVYRDPFSVRAEEITRQAILRADTHGMDHYGPAPAPIDEKRDLYQEAIEELLDAIYYMARQVARLEDLRGTGFDGQETVVRGHGEECPGKRGIAKEHREAGFLPGRYSGGVAGNVCDQKGMCPKR